MIGFQGAAQRPDPRTDALLWDSRWLSPTAEWRMDVKVT